MDIHRSKRALWFQEQTPFTPAEGIPLLCVPAVSFHSRSTREGAPDVHHPQTGRPIFPGTQRGERVIDPFPGILSARPSLLHHGHATGASQPGDEHSSHNTGETSHRGSGTAHPKGNFSFPLVVYDVPWIFVL